MTTTTTISNSNIKTYRHEFGKEFMQMLSVFSKVHQYDDRHAYKSEWTKWIQQENIAQTIDMEKRRLQENGYIGDIDDKMFKAGRYYFRKKTNASTAAATITAENEKDNKEEQREVEIKDNTDHNDKNDNNNDESETASNDAQLQQQQRHRRPYVTMSKETIRLMDDHIKKMHSAATTSVHDDTSSSSCIVQFKPSCCYDEFYQTKIASGEMTREIEKIIQKYQNNAGTMNILPDELTNEIVEKIKKTYKNRYYKFVSCCN